MDIQFWIFVSDFCNLPNDSLILTKWLTCQICHHLTLFFVLPVVISRKFVGVVTIQIMLWYVLYFYSYFKVTSQYSKCIELLLWVIQHLLLLPQNTQNRMQVLGFMWIFEMWKKPSQKIKCGLVEPYIHFLIKHLLGHYSVFRISV